MPKSHAAPKTDAVVPMFNASSSADGGAAAHEETRRYHLNAEANLKSIGTLSILGGVYVLYSVFDGVNTPDWVETVGAFAAAWSVMSGIVYLWAGVLIRKLDPMGRKVYTLLWGLGLVMSLAQIGDVTDALTAAQRADSGFMTAFWAILVGALAVPAFFVWLMHNAKGRVIFSERYRMVVLPATAHVKYKSKLFRLLLLAIALMVLGALGLAAAA